MLRVIKNLGVAAVFALGSMTVAGASANAQPDLEEEVRLCGVTTCGNGQSCTLCGAAQSQLCVYHANCQ